MREGWELISVANLCSRVTSGGTPRRQREGYYASRGSGTPWVKTKELGDGYISDTEERITERAIAESAAKILPRGTVLMAMYGATVGKLGILARPMTCNQACCAMIVDSEIADHRFLFYRLLLDRPRLVALANGAAQQNLNGSVIKDFKFPCPPLAEQRRIAGVLGALDDLIETNERLIVALDAVAIAVFRAAWNGTSTESLSNLGSLTMGQSPPGHAYNEQGEGLPFHQGIRDFTGRFPVSRVFCTAPTRIAESGDILIAVRAPVGVTNVARQRIAIGRGVAGLRADRPSTTLHALRADPSIWSAHMGTGTVFSSINKQGLLGLAVPFVDDDDLEGCLDVFDAAYDHVSDENETLRRTRDELLPLLMSGAVSPGEVEVAS